MDKRRFTQAVCAVLYNCNFTGFAKGTIYKGGLKGACVPGLNCYSCPGAIASCPLGSLQTALLSSRYKFPYYILGILLLSGVLLGRVICGFLCPFGLLQELLYKIPTKKFKKNKWTKRLSYAKYAVLLIFAIGIPLIFYVPGFCKYICPAGTLEGGLPLIFLNEKLKQLLGGLFSWKLLVLFAVLISVIFIFRGFCRFICPLGAFYALFHRISIFGMQVEEHKCTHCNQCISHCKMDIKHVGDAECLACGECMDVCKSHAISYKKMLHRP